MSDDVVSQLIHLSTHDILSLRNIQTHLSGLPAKESNLSLRTTHITNMPSLQRKRGKGVNSTLSCGSFVSIFLRVGLLLLIFLNLQTFGEMFDFCFDGSNEGKFGNVQFCVV